VRFVSQQNQTERPQPTIDFGYPTPAHGKIPAFNNIEEEAEFWDTIRSWTSSKISSQ